MKHRKVSPTKKKKFQPPGKKKISTLHVPKKKILPLLKSPPFITFLIAHS